MAEESRIRDYLADNMTFIDKGYRLIKKEYPVPNSLGSKGFIDILGRDEFNNFVIIEIKRSKTSSRETIQELIKYIGLLKQNFKIRDSEIKIVILSTHWEELLIPFSELVYQTTLHVIGYKLVLNGEKVPFKKIPIKPVNAIIPRKISRTMFFHLFYTENKRNLFIQFLIDQCHKIGIADFILLKLSKDINSVSNGLYPYALCFAFQSLSIDQYLAIINKEELDITQEESEEHEFVEYLEQELLIALDTVSYSDGGDSGYPEKLDSILTVQGWEKEEIMRFGIFETDPRYNDKMLLRELRGWDGSNKTKYLDYGESLHTDKLNEVIKECQTPLEYNKVWKKHIKNIFTHLQHLNKAYRFVIEVYQPESVFDSIWRSFPQKDAGYLPLYMLFINFLEDDITWVFGGKLSWNGREVNNDNLQSYLMDDTGTFFNKFLDCVRGVHDKEILKLFQLKYINTLAEFKNDYLEKESVVRFKDQDIIKSNIAKQSLSEWLNNSKETEDLLNKFYKEHTNYSGTC